MSKLPHILILSTGGTIAGEAQDNLYSSKYQAGVLSIDKLLDSLPPFQAKITYEEIARIDSVDMDFSIWHKLATTILNSKADAFVITHGTDTLEESAFFLDLIFKSKPVIFTCAMRPHNAIGSDGIKNLCNAISLAIYAHTHCNNGVKALCNDYIYDSSIFKIHTHNLNAFSSNHSLGYVLDGEVLGLKDTKPSPTLFLPNSLPQVEVLYTYAGMKDFSCNAQGLIVIGSGAGSIPSSILPKLRAFKQNGRVIINATRVPYGFVTQSEFIPSFSLSPLKAKILLELCLANGYSPHQIKETFYFWK